MASLRVTHGRHHHFIPYLLLSVRHRHERIADKFVSPTDRYQKSGRAKKNPREEFALDELFGAYEMSRYSPAQSVAGLVEGRLFSWFFSWRTLFNSIVITVLTWHRRRQLRQELLDYLAMDHRAAADIGISRSNARAWAARPFWRP
jgi:uncharacterized protein YjiS (DUF1127 family)